MDPVGTPDWFAELVLMFVVFPVVGAWYCYGIHRLSAWIVRNAPDWLARIFACHLYKSSWDYARGFDYVAAARRGHAKKAGRAIEGELMPRAERVPSWEEQA